ncbi:MAG: heme exporter protein CcmB [SAR324 cluster bacterium]|nr:heme exporter protein CcmB [SAR324 cluster bacterium]
METRGVLGKQGFFSQIGVLIWKDLLIDLRRKENLLGMFLFALLTLLIFNFAVGGGGELRYRITPRVMKILQDDGLPQESLAVLKPLVGRTYASRADLLEALDAAENRSAEKKSTEKKSTEKRSTEKQSAAKEAIAGAAAGALRIALLEHSGVTLMREAAPGLFWVTVLLAGMLGLSKSFAQEREQGCMDALLLTPVERGVIYLGKMFSNTLFLIAIQVMFLPVFSLFFGVGLRGVWLPLAVVMLGGTLGFAALGTLLGGVTASLKGREVLLPVLLFPLLTPLMVVAVYLTGVVLDGVSLWEQGPWLRLMAAFDGVFLIASFLVFEYVMEN